MSETIQKRHWRLPVFQLLKTVLLLLFLLGSSLLVPAQVAWKLKEGRLSTRWAADVNPDNAHAEYPRPQLVRETWQNLNGLWDYAFTPLDGNIPEQWAGKILVPFPIESALSGVMTGLDEKHVLWYRRFFTVPVSWQGQQIRLHFGAVDWQASVFINGQRLAVHRGGYDSFTLDITHALNWNNHEEIDLAVLDPTEGEQARGKQARHPEGVFYSQSSGIWQTVWLEPVPKVSIEELKLVPDLDHQALRLKVVAPSIANSWEVEATILTNGVPILKTNGLPNTDMTLAIPAPRLWSPDAPFLYDLKITLHTNGEQDDEVKSYFGLRKVSLGKDAKGNTRILLNNQFLFQAGIMDQGYWPDGLYTAPTDEAMRHDLEKVKQFGFNLVRKHVKVEPERWYYWCDKMGILVWQDMPSGNPVSDEARYQFEAELKGMIQKYGNHPSIIMWVVFNESWGEYDAERLTQWVKELDPSRLVDNASGWKDFRVGDVVDFHSYPEPIGPNPENNRAAVVGEFGGIGLGYQSSSNHWSLNGWSYKNMTNTTEFSDSFGNLWNRVKQLEYDQGLSAAVYTQLTDIETECDGLLTYDRAFIKLSPDTINAAVTNVYNVTLEAIPR